MLDEANLLYELEKSREDIIHHLGPEYSFSAEGPFGTEDERVMEYAYKIYPALRNRMPHPYLEELNRASKTAPGSSEKEYVQWQRGPLTEVPMDKMKSWVDTLLVHDNIWLVLVFHGVDGIGWQPKTHEELATYFEYMKEKEDHLWIATFADVSKYIRERMNAEVATEEEEDKLIVSLTHSLDDKWYRLPLTLKTYISPDWNRVQVQQEGNKQQVIEVVSDESGNYILYQATPNAGPVTLSEI